MPGIAEALQRRVQPFVAAHRFGVYAFLSVAAVLAITVNALRSHSNFYSVAVYLSRSSRTLIVLANFGFLTALISGRIMQKIFFGPLLPAEVERLYDRTWFFITESLLAFTIFRDEFDVSFSLMFGFLLFVKCFHWLMADRIEWMDQRPYPGPPPLFHIRIMSLFGVLAFTDLAMFMFAYQSIMQNDIGATILFANEYAILAVSAWNAFSKYSLTVYELRRASTRGGADAPPWEAKSSWIFYIELITDAIKLFTYSVFFAVITAHFGLPLNLIRDLYMTTASFFSRVTAFQRYRSATRDMDQRYPNASEAELAATDGTCIICREEMTLPVPGVAPAQQTDGPNMTPKKLPCGHIFHFSCLRSWLERQQNCPTCRRTVMDVAAPGDGNRVQRGPAQQGQANGGLPPPPQRPGGQARPWGLFAQAAQPREPVPGGYVGGFIRRLLGAAAGPPLVPGQFGNAPFAQQPGVPAPPVPVAGPAANIAQNGGAAGPGGQRPPALVFEYNYVHEFGQPPRLMAPPMLQGFYREDGLWQGWPGQGRVDAQPTSPEAAARPTPVVGPAASRTTPPATANGQAGATAPFVSSETAQSPDGSSSNDVSSSSATTERPETPREAAARAALRRFGGAVPAVSLPVPTTTTTTSDTTARLADSNTAPSGNTPTSTAPGTPAPSATASAVPTTTQTTAAQASGSMATQVPGNRVALPSVIPLYDFGRNPTPRQTPMPTPQRLPPAPPRFNFGNQPQLHQRGPTAPRVSTQPSLRPVQYMNGQPLLGPIRRLPPQLTDEELQRMDRLTRDAIDERIRVLEGVNGAVYRCLEELLRLRSVLPPLQSGSRSTTTPATTPSGAAEGLSSGPAASGGSSESTKDIKGKSKEHAPNASTFGPAGGDPTGARPTLSPSALDDLPQGLPGTPNRLGGDGLGQAPTLEELRGHIHRVKNTVEAMGREIQALTNAPGLRTETELQRIHDLRLEKERKSTLLKKLIHALSEMQRAGVTDPSSGRVTVENGLRQSNPPSQPLNAPTPAQSTASTSTSASEPALSAPAPPPRVDSLPLATTIVPAGAPEGQIPPLLAPAFEGPVNGAVVADQIAAAAGVIAELEPLANEIGTAEQPTTVQDSNVLPASLSPQVNATNAGPEALPGVDGVDGVILAVPAQGLDDEVGVEEGATTREESHAEEDPAAAERGNGDAGSGEEGGGWETVDNQTHSSESSNTQQV